MLARTHHGRLRRRLGSPRERGAERAPRAQPHVLSRHRHPPPDAERSDRDRHPDRPCFPMRAITIIGIAGVLYVLIFARYYYLSAFREHFGNAVIALLALAMSSIPTAGVVLGPMWPRRAFTPWRVLAIMVCA